MFPLRIIARRQLSSAQPTGIDGLAGFTVTVTVTKVVRIVTVVVDVTVAVEKFEGLEVSVPLETNIAVFGTKHEQAELIPDTTFGVHIEA